MKYKTRKALRNLVMLSATVLSIPADGYSQAGLSELERLQQSEVKAENASQQEIEKLDNQTRELLNEYNQLVRDVEQLKNVLPELRERVEKARESKVRYEAEVAELSGAEAQLLHVVGTMRRDLQSLTSSPFKSIDSKEHADLKQLSLVEELGQLLKQMQDLYESTGAIQLREDEQLIEGQKVVVDRVDVGRLVTYFITKDRKRGFVLAGLGNERKELGSKELALVQTLLSPHGNRLIELPYPVQANEEQGGA